MMQEGIGLTRFNEITPSMEDISLDFVDHDFHKEYIE